MGPISAVLPAISTSRSHGDKWQQETEPFLPTWEKSTTLSSPPFRFHRIQRTCEVAKSRLQISSTISSTNYVFKPPQLRRAPTTGRRCRSRDLLHKDYLSCGSGATLRQASNHYDNTYKTGVFYFYFSSFYIVQRPANLAGKPLLPRSRLSFLHRPAIARFYDPAVPPPSRIELSISRRLHKP